MDVAGTKRFTVHGLRYTFTDLTRRANVDPVVRRALTGHVTEEMQRKYSTVGIDEDELTVRHLSAFVERDMGFEPTTFSLGISDTPLQ